MITVLVLKYLAEILVDNEIVGLKFGQLCLVGPNFSQRSKLLPFPAEFLYREGNCELGDKMRNVSNQRAFGDVSLLILFFSLLLLYIDKNHLSIVELN